MSFRTTSQSRGSIQTAKNSQVIATSISNYNSGATSGPTITSIIVTDSGYNNLDDTAVGPSNSFIKIIGTGFITGANVYVGGTQVPVANVTFTSSTELRVALPVLTSGVSSAISIFNSIGSGAIYASNLLASGFPTVTTSSYLSNSLTISVQLLATGDGTLSYSLKSGSSLPSGLTLSSTGLISGTATTDSTTTFTVLVNDSQNQTTQQDITLVINSNDLYFKYTTLLLQSDNTSNNSTNSTIVDSSNNNYTITPTGSPIQGTNNPFGVGNWSNYFNGSSDYLAFPASTNYAFGTGDFTIECWYFATNFTGNNYLFDMASNGTRMQFYSGNVYFIPESGSYLQTATGYTLNTWNHIAMVRQSGTLYGYINGVSIGSVSNSSNLTNNNLTIGQYGGGASGLKYYGYISNFRIVNGTAVYPSGTTFTPSTTPLTAISGTALLTCQSNRFIDNSSNNFAITVNGNPTVERFNPFGVNGVGYDTLTANTTYSGSIFFNGTSDYLSLPSSTTNLNAGSSDFTIDGWLYTTSSGQQNIVYLGGNTGTYAGIRFEVNGGGTRALQILATTDGANWGLNYNAGSLQLNSWNHIALCRSGNSWYMFINGVQAGSTQTFAGTMYGGTYNQLGAYLPLGGCFSGYMSNMRFIKGTALYTTTFTPPTTPAQPIANTQFLLSNKNSGIYDATLQNNIRTVGDAKVRTNITKYGTGSMYFDGSGDYIDTTKNINWSTLGNITVEGWIYPTNLDKSVQVILGTSQSSNDGYTFIYVYGSGSGAVGKIGIGINGTNEITGSTGNITTNVWQHIAAVRNGSTTTVYVNGTSVGSSSTGVWSNNSRPVRIGMGPSSMEFTGYMDDVRITQGYARYTANFTPPNAALQNK